MAFAASTRHGTPFRRQTVPHVRTRSRLPWRLPRSGRRRWIDSIRNRYAPFDRPSACPDTILHEIGAADNGIRQPPFFFLSLVPGGEKPVWGCVLPTGECLPLLRQQLFFDDSRRNRLFHHGSMASRSGKSKDFQAGGIESEYGVRRTPVAATDEVSKGTIGPKKNGRHPRAMRRPRAFHGIPPAQPFETRNLVRGNASRDAKADGESREVAKSGEAMRSTVKDL